MNALIELLAKIVAPMQRQFINFVRVAICIVMVWIGGLKVCKMGVCTQRIGGVGQ